jgi:hypothetical protein
MIRFHDLKDSPETVWVPWGVSPVRENCASRPESTGGWILQAWFVAQTPVPDGLDQSARAVEQPICSSRWGRIP